MTPLDDLIARLEAASEGSRELDYAIHRAVKEYARNWLPDCPPIGDYPHYTKLVDAARTLFPTDYDWNVGTSTTTDGLVEPCFFGYVRGRSEVPPDPEGYCHHRGGAALALTIAALRALRAKAAQP